jgi:hypothetical protein
MELMVLGALLTLCGVAIGWTLARVPPRPVDDEPAAPAVPDATLSPVLPMATVSSAPPTATTSTTRIADDENPWWVPDDRIVE